MLHINIKQLICEYREFKTLLNNQKLSNDDFKKWCKNRYETINKTHYASKVA